MDNEHVECAKDECEIVLLKSTWEGKQYCSKEHREITELREAIKELQEKSEWINVEDRLPEKRPTMNYKQYLVTTGDTGFQADWMNGKFWYNCAHVGNAIQGVTFWMELPEPPTNKENLKGTMEFMSKVLKENTQ